MADVRPECPICGSAESVAWSLRKNDYDLYRCAGCDHIFVHPQPDAKELGRIYSFEGGYQVQEMQRFDEMWQFPAKLVGSLDRLVRRVGKGRLLDVGSSIGTFVYLAARAGFEAHGVELNRDTAAIAQANGLDVTVGTLEEADFEPGSFDAIHMADLIEHVPVPELLLRQTRRILRPGGTLLVLTPNHDAFFPRATHRLFRMFGIPWSHPTPPWHLNQFSATSLTRLLEREGFAIQEEHYDPCSLKYEMRATRTFFNLKRSLRTGRFAAMPFQAMACAAVTATYPPVWLLDRLLPRKRRDFAMTFLVTPSG